MTTPTRALPPRPSPTDASPDGASRDGPSRDGPSPDGPTLALVAGEASGDLLGASLMRALRARRPELHFVGVGGPHMRALGLDCLLPAEALAMNGLAEPLRRLPELVALLRRLRRTFAERGAGTFVGIDFNVFNLLLARTLRRDGLATVHYVSPSVYAWRRGRVRRMRRALDRILVLYPFEPPLYREARLDAVFVGHPLADEILPVADPGPARRRLGLDPQATVLTVMPGSRRQELALLGDDFLAAAERFAAAVPGTQVVVALLDEAGAARLRPLLAARPGLDVRLCIDDTRTALAACDLALVKSGTGTLEAMLTGRPMVVGYRLGPWTYRLLRPLVSTPHFALPNLLAGERLVPELIQDAVTPERLADALLAVQARSADLRPRFAELGASLRRDAAGRAADAVLEIIDAERGGW